MAGNVTNPFGGQGPAGTFMGGTSIQEQLEAAGPGARLEVDMSPSGMQNGGYKVVKGKASKAPEAPSGGGAGAAVAAPAGGGGAPLAVKPPSVAGLNDGGGGDMGLSEGAAGQSLSGPTSGRTNIGNRMPPSLAALLRPRVY